ncbi:MAG TPA: SIMPL domain-containing protein [Woeseiaceae bacterium]|nr:SIMPL domain-containing protein [Woeseiaceae bacterium]
MQRSGAMKSAALLGVFVLGLAGPAAADGDVSERRSITVDGSGFASGTPDQAMFDAGVETMAATVIEASKQNQAAVAQVMQALAAKGIDKKDIQTSNYRIWPERRHEPGGNSEPVITGYRVSNSISVLVRKIDRLGEILGALTDAGSNSIGSIEFLIENNEALQESARAAAMADAKRKADALAKLAGVQLGEVLLISMSSDAGYPMPLASARFEMASAAPQPSISEGQISAEVRVHVVYAIQ